MAYSVGYGGNKTFYLHYVGPDGEYYRESFKFYKAAAAARSRVIRHGCTNVYLITRDKPRYMW